LSQILNIWPIVADFQDFPIVADFLVVVELVVLWWSKNMSMALATSSSSQARSPLSSQDVEEEEEEEDKEVAAAAASSLVHDDAIEVESSRSFLMALQVSYKIFLFWVCVCVCVCSFWSSNSGCLIGDHCTFALHLTVSSVSCSSKIAVIFGRNFKVVASVPRMDH
jgi:hypothetical protein